MSEETTKKMTYRELTEKFFASLKAKEELADIAFTDVTFLEGYFIFTFGEDSVVHFHINKCPGWKFGIWWDEVGEEAKPYYNGKFFTQYEDTIDKFKPTASEINTNITIYPKGEDSLFETSETIEFIEKEPYLAFCRDYCFMNYNFRYLSRRDAKKIFCKYKRQKAAEDKYTKKFDAIVLNWVREYILPMFTDATIEDMGENWSPRYDVFAPFEKNKDIVDERGCYGWFGDDDESQRLKKKFDRLIKRLEKRANRHNVWWYNTIYDSITFTSNEEKEEETELAEEQNNETGNS